jgi:hypothetical protein
MKRKDITLGSVVYVASGRGWDTPSRWAEEDGRVDGAVRYTIEDTRALTGRGIVTRDRTGEATDTRPDFLTENGEVVKGYALAVPNTRVRWMGDDMTLILASYLFAGSEAFTVRSSGREVAAVPPEKRYLLLRLADIRGLYDEVVPRLVEANKAAYLAQQERNAADRALVEKQQEVMEALAALGIEGLRAPYGGPRLTLEITVESARKVARLVKQARMLGYLVEEWGDDENEMDGSDFIQSACDIAEVE